MGSGASKKSRPGKHRDAAVTAEVVIPGQTRPIKVKGHVRSGSPGSLEGGAKLTEVAPSKYNVMIGNKDIGTFDVPDSDFASYLRHAASLTVTNIKAVDGEDDFTPAKRHLRLPLARQATVISAYNYSDDEDWEDVAQSLDRSESSYSNEEQQKEAAKERRSRIKQAIREKREKLSQQEYQQMIANHKQEMELMAILREREKERHQMKLGSKVAERKRRREARLAEKRGQEKPLAVKEDAPAVTEKKVIKYQDVDKTEKELLEQLGSDVEHGGHATQRQKKSFLNKLAASKSNKVLTVTELQQLEAELEDKQREFNTVLKEKKLQISDEDYKKLIAEHKLQLGRIQEKLELQRSRQRQAMLDKLAARKKMREQGEEDKNSLSADEIKELQLALNHRAMAFRDELKDTRSQLSAEECQRMIEGHRREMETMQEQLDRERERMRRELMEKLENRRKRSKEQLVEDMEPCFSLEELKQLQLTIDVKNTSEKQEIASRKNRVSSAEHRKLLDQHQQEIEEMERRLEEERDVSRQRLEGKLAERRNRRPKSGLICGDERIPDKESGPDEVQSLQEEIYSEEKRFREEVEEKRSGMSEEVYQKLLEQHKREMERLQQKLQDSQERQKQRWQDKLAERRRKRDQDEGFTAVLPDSDTEHSVTRTTGQGIEATFEESSVREKAGDSPVQVVQENSKGQRLKLESEADFVSVMALLDKIKDDHTTSITEDDLNQLEQDLKNYSQTVHESLDAKRGIFPDEELDLMISEHRRNMETMANRLENQRLRIEEKLNRKLRSRQARALSDYTEGAADVREAEILYQEGLVSSDEEDDEFDDLSDTGVTVPQLATTQFWTTPIQSMDVLIVPLADEYPVLKKSELYTDPSIFRDLDAHAIRLAQTVSLVTQPTFSSLVGELTSIASSELEKVRVVFRWITAQNCEEMNLNDVVDDTPLGVLKGLYQKKITFSTLFMRMCRFVGLQCVEIAGIARVKGYTPGMWIDSHNPTFHHTWNAVRIDGYWHFVDCNWGVSHIPGSVTFDPFRFEYDEHYFLADPDVMVSSHYPNDSSWQLLESAVSVDDFNRAVLLKPDFFKYGFGLESQRTAILNAPHGEIDLRVKCPLGIRLSCRLSEAETGSQMSNHGISFSQFHFIHQITEDTFACYIRIPQVGMFLLTIFAKRQITDDGQWNLESPTEICQYMVHCTSPSKDSVPLPPSPADHWGPIGVHRAGVVPLSHSSGVIISQDDEDISIIFKKTKDIAISHSLASWRGEEDLLKGYVMQRTTDDRVIFTVAPPRPDRYGLHVFLKIVGYARPVHLCSYLIVASSMRQSVQPFPALRENEKWGPSEAFKRMGLFHISNADPYIITHESIVIIEIGKYESREFTYHFYCQGKEAQDQVEMQSSIQQCSFIMELQQIGFHVLKVFAREVHSEGLPFAHVCSYLIKKL